MGTKGGGLNVFRDGKFHSLTTVQGLLSNVVLTMAAAPNGDVWVGTPDGLNLLHNGDVPGRGEVPGLSEVPGPGQVPDYGDGPGHGDGPAQGDVPQS